MLGSRAAWIAAVQASSMPEKQKQLAMNIHKTYRRWRMYVAPWELEGSPSYESLHGLAYYGFLYLIPGNGVFVRVIDPLAEPGSITTTKEMDRIIRRMLAGNTLYHINRAGYVNRTDCTRKWKWCDGPCSGKYEDEQATYALAELGIIQRDGCGHGWPKQYTSRVQIDMRKLIGVTKFQRIAQKWLDEHRPK